MCRSCRKFFTNVFAGNVVESCFDNLKITDFCLKSKFSIYDSFLKKESVIAKKPFFNTTILSYKKTVQVYWANRSDRSCVGVWFRFSSCGIRKAFKSVNSGFSSSSNEEHSIPERNKPTQQPWNPRVMHNHRILSEMAPNYYKFEQKR